MVTDLTADILLRVFGGFLELTVSKDDDFTYDFECLRHYLKTILTSKSLKKVNKKVI
jgi:hypothetical protein